MEFVTDQLKLIGLNEREIRVFTALATFGRMNMTKLAGRSQVARTTADAIIRRLLEQGVVKRQEVGKHYEYTVDLEDVAQRLDALEDKLAPTKDLDYDEKNVKSGGHYVDSLQNLEAHTGERCTYFASGQMCIFLEEYRHIVCSGLFADLVIGSRDVEHLNAYAYELVPHLPETPIMLIVLPQSFLSDAPRFLLLRSGLFLYDDATKMFSVHTDSNLLHSWSRLLSAVRESGWMTDLRTHLDGMIEVE